MNIRSLPSSFRGQSRPRVTTRWKGPWCNSCRIKSPFRASFSTSPRALEKPYYITSPIFYVNAAPHVGHLYTMVLTDILKRWQVLRGKKAILCTGTDEHGMKIQQAAAKANIPPKEFCDLTSQTFLNLAERAEMSYDHFVRTSDEDHKEAVQYFWFMLKTRGYIYESKHQGWYCVSDETYYPESAIEKRLDPQTGKTFMASQETGKEVEWSSESNYHFRLSAFKDRLLEFYKENPEFVVPATRMNDVVQWVSAGLEDLSISRPVERLSWGIRVPDDPSQTIYVWLDALVNYITKAGYPWAPGKQSAGGWPADVHVIGKDIVRFHCIYWPAFLLALDIPPPKQILAHAHWTLGNQKMAKSTGNVVNPLFAMDRFGIDVMRYYLAHDGGIKNDSDYGNDLIVERYKKGLQGGIGNLVSRITRPKIWSVKRAVEAARDGTLRRGAKYTKEHAAMLSDLARLANVKMEQLDPGAALQLIMNAVYVTNKYLTHCAPWELAKTQDIRPQKIVAEDGGKTLRLSPWLVAKSEEMKNVNQKAQDGLVIKHAEAQDLNQLKIERTIFHCAEAIRIVGILLQPYMPTKAAQLLDMLGVDEGHRTFDYARLDADYTYGTPKLPSGKRDFDSLFPPLSVVD
ncbi:putative methionine--tRNA ligase, mitochondrial [Lachnellula cervina]|uniref:Probable methionine--tRNA ligase, mitochondrial n=1 Tax=Lachnellula cervina TaxID=1316786 RepID=A0A7D8UNE3_9HELO|nr:putative methionine--tRNA ligase, mitochondrial [Lachnellula cervina]